MPAAELDGAGTLLARYVDGVTVKGTTSYKVVADNLGRRNCWSTQTTVVVAQRLGDRRVGTSDGGQQRRLPGIWLRPRDLRPTRGW